MSNRQRIKYLVSIALLFIVVYSFVNLYLIAIKQDPSLESSHLCSNDKLEKVWLVSYADGSEVNFRNQRYQIKSALNKCIDYYMPYNGSDIDVKYRITHNKILSQERGAGYWLWKPYIILKTLDKIPENDIVLYVDAGVSLRAPIDLLLSKINDNNILAFKSFADNILHTKRDLLKSMGVDDEDFLLKKQIQASFIFFKNNKETREFVEEWLKWCENEEAITDSVSREKNYPDFVEHRHDQAIFSILTHKLNNKIILLPLEESERYFFHHRRRQYSANMPLSHIELAQYNDGWLAKFLYYSNLIFSLAMIR